MIITQIPDTITAKTANKEFDFSAGTFDPSVEVLAVDAYFEVVPVSVSSVASTLRHSESIAWYLLSTVLLLSKRTDSSPFASRVVVLLVAHCQGNKVRTKPRRSNSNAEFLALLYDIVPIVIWANISE